MYHNLSINIYVHSVYNEYPNRRYFSLRSFDATSTVYHPIILQFYPISFVEQHPYQYWRHTLQPATPRTLFFQARSSNSFFTDVQAWPIVLQQARVTAARSWWWVQVGEWVSEWVSDWLTGWLADWLTDRLIDWLADRLADRLAEWKNRFKEDAVLWRVNCQVCSSQKTLMYLPTYQRVVAVKPPDFIISMNDPFPSSTKVGLYLHST